MAEYRGVNGAVFDIDPERFAEQIAAGDLVKVEVEKKAAPKPVKAAEK